MITTSKLSESDVFVVERVSGGGGGWAPVTRHDDYDSARASALELSGRVVMHRTSRFVCEDA